MNPTTPTTPTTTTSSSSTNSHPHLHPQSNNPPTSSSSSTTPASTTPTPPSSTTETTETTESPITQCLTYLQTRNDTARFVGLAMLSSILKNENVMGDGRVLRKLWEAMPVGFLDRLVRSGLKSKNTPEEKEKAKDMLEVAVNVIHAFAMVLPGAAGEERMVGRAGRLVWALKERGVEHSSESTKTTILETLSIFSSTQKGARAILSSASSDNNEDVIITPLLDVAVENDLGMQVILHTLVNGVKSDGDDEGLYLQLAGKVLHGMLERFGGSGGKGAGIERGKAGKEGESEEGRYRARRLRMLTFFSEVLPRVPFSVFPTSASWVRNIYACIRNTITSKHSSTERSHATIICATLLQDYPPTLLFQATSTATTSSTSKPFTPFFIRLLLIDIRSTIPSLMEHLSSPSYPLTSHRLSSDFDILTAFITYLLTIDSSSSSPFDDPKMEIDPEGLLRFRKEMSETLGLSMEFLRDRWDAKFAGVSGYTGASSSATTTNTREEEEEDISEPPSHTPGKQILDLPWDTATIEGGLLRDPLIMSSIRTLSLWLREDDLLRKEAGGLMDVFLGLWRASVDSDGSPTGGATVDYRLYLTSALEGTLGERNGRELFTSNNGWDILWGEIKHVYSGLNTPPTPIASETLTLTIESLRILTHYITESPSYMDIPHLETKLLEVVGVCRVTSAPHTISPHALHDLTGMQKQLLTLDTTLLHLASCLWGRLPGGSYLRKKKKSSGNNEIVDKILRLWRELSRVIAGGDVEGREEEKEVVDEVAYLLREIEEGVLGAEMEMMNVELV